MFSLAKINPEIFSLNLLNLILIISVWAFLIVVFSGIGSLFLRWFGFEPRSKAEFFNSFWAGWALAVFFLQIWHIFLPVDWRAAGLIYLAGSIGSVSLARKFGSRRFEDVCGRWFVAVALGVGIWLAYRSMLNGYGNYDAGLYHLNSVRWNSEYPLVPGLGNLHGRLAFNSAHFLYVALLEAGTWAYKSSYIANGVLAWVFSMQIGVAWMGIFKAPRGHKIEEIFFALCLFPFLLLPTILGNISSSSPDLSVAILAMVLSAYILSLLASGRVEERETKYRIYLIAVISALGIIIKLNFLVFGAGAVGLAYYYLAQNQKAAGSRRADGFQKIAGILAVSVGIWMLRGILLSGYVAYPFPLGSAPFDWRMPLASVVNMAQWTSAWARQPQAHHWSYVVGDGGWLKGWVERISADPTQIVFPLLLTVFCLCFLMILKYARANYKIPQITLYPFLLLVTVAIGYWFLTAPDPRFGAVFFWVGAVGLLAAVLYRMTRPKAALITVVFAYSLLFGIMGLKGVLALPVPKQDLVRLWWVSGPAYPWNLLNQVKLQFYEPPRAALEMYVTRSGLTVYVPAVGDQCWDSALTCSPYPHPGLRLRKGGELRLGFMIDPRNEYDPSVGIHLEWAKDKWVPKH